MHIKIKLFKSYCNSIYGSELWSLKDDVLQNCCCSWRTALRRLLNLPFNAHCFVLPILTGTLPVFDEICKRSSHFINSGLRSCYNLIVLLCTALFMVTIIRVLRNLGFCCRRFGWQLEDFCVRFCLA